MPDPEYAYPCLQDIYKILSARYGRPEAMAMLAEGAVLDADFLALRGVDTGTLDCALEFDLFDLSLLPAGWGPVRFVSCGDRSECGECRKGGVCLEIKNEETGDLDRCLGVRFPLWPRAPVWPRSDCVQEPQASDAESQATAESQSDRGTSAADAALSAEMPAQPPQSVPRGAATKLYELARAKQVDANLDVAALSERLCSSPRATYDAIAKLKALGFWPPKP